jgi:hypothetical protein
MLRKLVAPCRAFAPITPDPPVAMRPVEYPLGIFAPLKENLLPR